MPSTANSSLVVTGFAALEHFADVVKTGAACQSGLLSALRTMELVARVLDAAVPYRAERAG